MKNRWLGAVALAAMWAYAAIVFPRLPARIPTHWGLGGEVDGWSSRWPGAFFAPAVATVVFLILQAMPLVDPRRRNVERTGETRQVIANLVVLFLAGVEALTLQAALGGRVDVATAMPVGVGVLLMGMGNYLPRVRSNWWIGIRTPWTMDSERVWRDTHRLGGRAFVAGGALLLLLPLLPAAARGVLLIGVIGLTAAVPVIYSFVAWKREASGRTQ